MAKRAYKCLVAEQRTLSIEVWANNLNEATEKAENLAPTLDFKQAGIEFDVLDCYAADSDSQLPND